MATREQTKAALDALDYWMGDAEMSVIKELPGGRYALLSQWWPRKPDVECEAPKDLDAPAIFTIWNDDGPIDDVVHERATVREAMLEIERMCEPPVDVDPPGVR